MRYALRPCCAMMVAIFVLASGLGHAQETAPADVKNLMIDAECGEPMAQLILGRHYLEGDGVEQDDKMAAKWVRMAAESGLAEAQAAMGTLFFIGRGVPLDYREAAKWHRMGAEGGSALGQSELGVMYLTGKGVPKDETEGAKWLRKAADQGNAQAQATLGHLYVNGTGVTQDKLEAYKWLSLAAAEGVPVAEVRDGLAKDFTPSELATAQERATRFAPASLLTDKNSRHTNSGTRSDHKRSSIGGDLALNVSSQIVSAALVFAIFKWRKMPWRTWQSILAANIVALVVNALANIASLYVAPLVPASVLAAGLATGAVVTVIAWPVFSVFRADGKFIGPRAGLQCAVAYTVLSTAYALVSRALT